MIPSLKKETILLLSPLESKLRFPLKKVKPLVDGYGWEYHVLLDPNGEFKRAMNVQNIPHLFVIDKHGKTVYNHAGYTDGSEAEILSKLKGER